MDNSRRRSAQYGYFTGENVSRAFTNCVKVTATELFVSNSRVYVEIDTCVEAIKQVILEEENISGRKFWRFHTLKIFSR